MPSPLLGISPKTLCIADTAGGAASLAPSPPSFNHKKEISEPGMAAHRWHPSIREGEARALPQISLDYVVRPSVPAPQNKRGKRKWLNGKNTHCLSFTPRTPRTKSLLSPFFLFQAIPDDGSGVCFQVNLRPPLFVSAAQPCPLCPLSLPRPPCSCLDPMLNTLGFTVTAPLRKGVLVSGNVQGLLFHGLSTSEPSIGAVLAVADIGI